MISNKRYTIETTRVPVTMLPDVFLNQLGVFTHRGLLTPAECRAWWQHAARKKGRPGTVNRGGQSVQDDSVRRVREVDLESEEKDRFNAQIEPIRQNLEHYFGVALGPLGEQQCLLYEAGDHFALHSDSVKFKGGRVTNKHRRFISVLVFLNTPGDHDVPYEGGELAIYGLMNVPGGDDQGFIVEPEQGKVVAFRSNQMHAVSPVLSGHRYVIAGCFHDLTVG